MHPLISSQNPPRGRWNIDPVAFAAGEADTVPSLLLTYSITGDRDCQGLFYLVANILQECKYAGQYGKGQHIGDEAKLGIVGGFLFIAHTFRIYNQIQA